MSHQGGDDPVPSPSKEGDQSPAWPTTPLRMRNRSHRFGRNGFVDFAAYGQQPPGGNGHGQPQPLGSDRIFHARVLPLPTTAFNPFKSLLDPGTHAIPANIRSFGRQVSHDQPRLLMPGTPISQQGTFQSRFLILEQTDSTLPALPDAHDQTPQITPMIIAW